MTKIRDRIEEGERRGGEVGGGREKEENILFFLH